MLITTAELIAYTVFDEVKERPDALLKQDILEAEVEVKGIVGHDFSGADYQPLPDEVKLAIKKMAQYYALVNSDESLTKGIKSEKIGDYSYTVSDTSGTSKPDVSGLLKAFILPDEATATGNARFRMRAL
ncbi:protein YqbG [Domibacillus iocasae]|uniref:DUF3199 domain-containing protein n=1 Tax=Domibacillus iocasae TaxID=1714016 RepID=A0A1E7DS29_9BACI|nr:DUF3199 family protein [Domibacillus iocasae]OES45815.1 hypothetical protein BA724_03145 [Domibacillus iocasae]